MVGAFHWQGPGIASEPNAPRPGSFACGLQNDILILGRPYGLQRHVKGEIALPRHPLTEAKGLSQRLRFFSCGSEWPLFHGDDVVGRVRAKV